MSEASQKLYTAYYLRAEILICINEFILQLIVVHIHLSYNLAPSPTSTSVNVILDYH